jgi:hypothetical protein
MSMRKELLALAYCTLRVINVTHRSAISVVHKGVEIVQSLFPRLILTSSEGGPGTVGEDPSSCLLSLGDTSERDGA